jgi:hypothetical protein
MHFRIERVAWLETQSAANSDGKYNLALGGKLGLHGKKILPANRANHKEL